MRLALGGVGVNGDPEVRDRLISRIRSGKDAGMPLDRSTDELQKMRSYPIKSYFKSERPAQFSIALTHGAKVQEVKFLNGADELRPAQSEIAALKFDVEFPDDGPTKIVRYGVLNCSEVRHDCLFVLYPAIPAPKAQVP